MNNVWISFIWVEEWQSKCKEDHHSYTCTWEAATYRYAVAERKPEKIQACQDLNPDLCDTSWATIASKLGAGPYIFLWYPGKVFCNCN